MIPKIKKILYTTDLSVNSAYVFRYALSSAEKHDAKIHVLHVIEPTGGMGFAPPAADKAPLIEKIKKRIKKLTEGEDKKIPSFSNRVADIKVLAGNPAEVILKEVEEIKPDIVIMGTHSQGIIANALLGSVAMKILQRIKIPVYVIPIPALPTHYADWLVSQQ